MLTCSVSTVEDFGSFERTETGAKGWMTKQGFRVKSWKRRFFLLQGNIFSYWSFPGDSAPLGEIPLGFHQAKIGEGTGQYGEVQIEGKPGFLFDLVTQSRTYHILADDKESMDNWIEILNLKIKPGSELITDAEEQKKRNNEIEKQIEKEKRTKLREVKLLLLGTGESGKSTIFKQLKILQDNGGYSEGELLGFKPIVYTNCITQMKALIKASIKLNIFPESSLLEEKLEFLNNFSPAGDVWDSEVAQSIEILWKSKFIQDTYEQRDKQFHLNDTASYFFDNIQRISQDDYIPNEQDVLRARVRSTGIEEAEFTFADLSFRMLDVGGQRSERRKWIHCFDCVTAVIFCTAISEYDQNLREDESQNRIYESLLLFEEISNMAWFKETAFILFLNKIDLFKEKLEKTPLKVCFPEYTGKNEFEEASHYMKNKFLEQNTSPHVIYCHFTCAISTENIKFVFKVVRETIVKNVLNDIF